MNHIAAFLFVVATVYATDYCSDTICGKGVTHIVCGNSGKFQKSCPSNAKMVDITDTLKKVILDAHNAKRNLIAGGGEAHHKPACRMATMEWDNELATIASFNVKQCKMAHDKCRNTDTFKYAGQNLAWMAFTGPVDDTERLKQAVNSWYSEVKDCNQTFIEAYPYGYAGPTIGHFTVMMADRNERVGCSAAKYDYKDTSLLAYLVACNYATTNMVGFPIYTSCKEAATSCTNGTNPLFPNLCSVHEEYDVNKWF